MTETRIPRRTQRRRRTPVFLLLFAAVLVAGLLAAVIYAGASGCAGAAFIPALSIAPVDGAAAILGLAAYGVLLLIPTFYSIREAILWHSLRSKI